MPPEPLPFPHHPRTKATTTSSNEQPRSCDTEVELVRMEVMDMTSYCVGVLRYREAWFRTWRNMCRPDARLERGRQNRAWTRLSNPTCPFWGNDHISTCSTYAPPHTAGIPWNSVPSPVVRQVAVEVVGGEPHTCGRRQKYVYPTFDAPQCAMELGVVTGTGIRQVGSPDARMSLLNWK